MANSEVMREVIDMTKKQKIVHWLTDHHVLTEKQHPKYERYSLTITIKKLAARMRH